LQTAALFALRNTGPVFVCVYGFNLQDKDEQHMFECNERNEGTSERNEKMKEKDKSNQNFMRKATATIKLSLSLPHLNKFHHSSILATSLSYFSSSIHG
jgi:hypothetical protein